MALQLPPDFKEFLKLLNARRVEYLIIDGYAVAFHGYPRATADLDVWIAIHPENAKRLMGALQDFGFHPPDLSQDLFLKEGQVIRMGVPPVRIELLTSISGVQFGECFSSRTLANLDGVEVPLIDLAHLRTNKKAAGRHKDLSDLENLPS
jgi:hypothetical protein